MCACVCVFGSVCVCALRFSSFKGLCSIPFMQMFLLIGGIENTLPFTLPAFCSERRRSVVTNDTVVSVFFSFGQCNREKSRGRKARLGILNHPLTAMYWPCFGNWWCTVAAQRNAALGITALTRDKRETSAAVFPETCKCAQRCLDSLPRHKWDLADNAFWS